MIIVSPLNTFFTLLITAMNIVEVFLFVRFLLSWKKIHWLQSFDSAGKPLTDQFISLVNKITYRIKQKRLTCQGCLIVGISIFEMTKLLLCSI